MRILMQHLMDFPNGDHDDGADAFEMALRKMRELLSTVEGGGAVENPY